jgi:hypothetical protein
VVSGSAREVQELADQILALLGVRMRAGQLVIHYNEGLVQRCETNTVHRPRLPKVPVPDDNALDKPARRSAV